MKDVYEKNPQMGDPATLASQISQTAQNIERLKGEMSKYEVIPFVVYSHYVSLFFYNENSLFIITLYFLSLKRKRRRYIFCSCLCVSVYLSIFRTSRELLDEFYQPPNLKYKNVIFANIFLKSVVLVAQTDP